MSTQSTTRETVLCSVVAHLPFGLLVEIENNEKGVVRIRETSWDADERNQWKRRFPVGKRLTAAVLRRPEGRYIELSLRLAQEDPWDRVEQLFREGQTVTGVVTGVKHYGAFIEIHPGLTGLLHQSRLPPWCKKNTLDLFWPGDLVKVFIQKIDPREKQISLGAAPFSFAQEPPPVGAGAAPASPAAQTTPPVGREQVAVHLPFEKLQEQNARRSILIVEDDVAQGKEIENWLYNLGQRVQRVTSAEEGLNLIEKDPPDLIIADLGLPGMNGVDLLRMVRAKWPAVQCVLNTSWLHLDQHTESVEALQRAGVTVLFKPLLPDDLLDLLIQQAATDGPAPQDDAQSPDLSVSLDLKDAPLPDVQRASFQSALRKLLRTCLEETEFSLAMLFQLDPVHRKVDVLYQYGSLPGVQLFLDDLIYSPVRDVAEDGELVRVEDVNTSASRDTKFRYLLPVVPFTACVGVSIPNQLLQNYALFLFDTHARQIYDDEVAYAQATALAIGSLMERRMLTDQLRAGQKMTMLGHLSSYLAHELNHGLAPLNNSTDNLEIELNNLAETLKQDPAQAQRDLASALESLSDVRLSVSNLISTVRAFRDLLTTGKKQIVNMDELVRETLTLLQQTSQVNRVRLSFQPGESLTAIRSQMPLLQHVLLNLIMNAIEQITETRPGEGGQVRLRVETANETGPDAVIRLLVEDNGPGIHWRLWDKIFEAGFTSRKDGSGLGLYISRSIVDSLGGRLYVQESYINNGSTFVVELPYKI